MGISPSALDFGSVRVGTSSQRTLTYTNDVGSLQQIADVEIRGMSRGSFQESHSGNQVPPRSSLPIVVTFSPPSAGACYADIFIRFVDGTMTPAVQLSGAGS